EPLGEVIEVDVARLVDALGHVDGAVSTSVPTVEHTVADPEAAAATGRLRRIEARLEERHRDHRLDGGPGRIEPLEYLVAQRHPLVLTEHLVLDAADPVREAVRIEARHRSHAQEVAGQAIDHDDRAALEPDPPGGVVLQRAVDSELDRLSLDVLAGLEVAHDPTRCGDLAAPCARLTAQRLLELLLEPVLAELESRSEQQRGRLGFVFLTACRTDIADQVPN